LQTQRSADAAAYESDTTVTGGLFVLRTRQR
jgi:hypothetical protein